MWWLLFLVIASSDYESVDITVSFPENSEDGSQSCFDVSITNDTLFEKTQNFSLHIGAVEDNVHVHNEYFIVSIHDDDCKETLG